MKFGKELKERSVRGWEDHYMSYKRFKRIIKKLVVQLKEREELSSSSSSHSPPPYPSSPLPPSSSSDQHNINTDREWEEAILTRDARKEFFEEIEKDIERVNQFFLIQLEEMNEEFNSLMDGSHLERRQSSRSLLTHPSSSLASRLLRPISPLLPSSSSLSRSITISHSSLLDRRSDSILSLYRRYLNLLSFSFVNQQGFIKAMKKYDKYGQDNQSPSFHQRLTGEELVKRREEVEGRIERVEDLYMRVSIARNVDAKRVRQILRAVQRDVEEGEAQEDEGKSSHSLLFIALAIIVTLLLASLPLLPLEEQPAHRCLLLLALVTVLWVTEAVPFFVTSLLIPLLTVLSGILTDSSGEPLPADKASKAAFGCMFSDSVVLILGGFSISAAFSKCQYELRLMSMIQFHLGHHPRLFLLAYMLLAAFLSMLISNVASPILLTTLLLPIIRDLQRSNVYARTLLLALAFACNVGGMMSPIASPENAIVLGYLEERNSKHAISWLTWMKLSVPIGIMAIVIIWSYLCLVLLRNEVLQPIPPILIEEQKVGKQDWITIVCTLVSVMLWCSLSAARDVFGVMATVAIIPLVVFFGVGLLNVTDVRNFSWHLILLICGGNVLGEAVRSSRLLALLTDPLIPWLSRHEVWTVCMVMIGLVFLLSSFVPHTVAALILTPVVITIGQAIHHTHSLVFTTIFMLNLTMSLPVSTFPNINSWLVDDDFHRPFLHARDFVKHGVGVSLLMVGLMATAGYALLRLTFGKSLW